MSRALSSIHRPTDILPAAADVEEAAFRLQDILTPTACVPHNALAARCGVDVYLKCELDNPTGSFKVRGAYTVLARMTPEARARGVVASSAGNHGLGVAYAARVFGAPATLYVPSNAPQVKKDGIRSFGANVDDQASNYDDAMVRARKHAQEHDILFINPCLGLDLLAGQGTVALEILNQQPEVRTIVLPTGGGGLLGGVGAVIRELAPHVRIVGVQSEETAAIARSVEQGAVVAIPNTPTLADGLAGQIDDDALRIATYCADDMVLVSEDQIGETIAWLHRDEDMTVEGAGAVAIAALRHGMVDDLEGPVVAVASGRNIDATRLQTLLARFAAE